MILENQWMINMKLWIARIPDGSLWFHENSPQEVELKLINL